MSLRNRKTFLVSICVVVVGLYMLSVVKRACTSLSCSHAVSPVPMKNLRASGRPSVHVVAYATALYKTSAVRLLDSAASQADFLRLYTRSDINAEFMRRNSEVMSQSRGGGMWVWKPYVVLNQMRNEAEPNDVVVYCDSRFAFSHKTVPMVLRHLRNDDFALFRNKPTEAEFLEIESAKSESFRAMGLEPDPTVITPWAGFVAFRVNNRTIRFVSEWLEWTRDPVIWKPQPLPDPHNPKFVYNREDQSALSLLIRRWNLTTHHMQDDELINYHVRVFP